MEDARDAKRCLRARLRHKRDAASAGVRAACDRAIEDRARAWLFAYQPDLVLAYAAFGSEVDTHGLVMRLLGRGTRVALPRCDTRAHTMSWWTIASWSDVRPGAYGIAEPCGPRARRIDPAAFTHAVAIVPALAFDRHGFRMGYGGGYYDRFLAGFSGVSIGLCRSSELVDDLRVLGGIDAYDQPVDVVVTDQRVIMAHALDHQIRRS